MRKLIALALFGLMFMSGLTKSYAQQDSAKIAEEPKDTISIDNMDPVAPYNDEESTKSSNGLMYAVIGGIVVVAGGAFYFIRKKKK